MTKSTSRPWRETRAWWFCAVTRDGRPQAARPARLDTSFSTIRTEVRRKEPDEGRDPRSSLWSLPCTDNPRIFLCWVETTWNCSATWILTVLLTSCRTGENFAEKCLVEYWPFFSFSGYFWSNSRKLRADFWPKNDRPRSLWLCFRCMRAEVRWSGRRPCGGSAPSHWQICTAYKDVWYTRDDIFNRLWYSSGIELSRSSSLRIFLSGRKVTVIRMIIDGEFKARAFL